MVLWNRYYPLSKKSNCSLNNYDLDKCAWNVYYKLSVKKVPIHQDETGK